MPLFLAFISHPLVWMLSFLLMASLIFKKIAAHYQAINEKIDQTFKIYSVQIDKELHRSFENTRETFKDLLTRLAVIDHAQKRITELSGNILSLQDLLSNHKKRGIFGEIQLLNLIKNVLPERYYKMQPTLSNGKRADCILLLPPPTGHIVVDSKFPLENFQKSHIKKHIDDIAEKYIIPGETAEGAILFLPAESLFAEIHNNHPDLIEYSYQKNVWITSPTTMMAILTVAHAALKDISTRKAVHSIRQSILALGKDFEVFSEGIEKLERHLHLAIKDIQLMSNFARKLNDRFDQIERVEPEEV